MFCASSSESTEREGDVSEPVGVGDGLDWVGGVVGAVAAGSVLLERLGLVGEVSAELLAGANQVMPASTAARNSTVAATALTSAGRREARARMPRRRWALRRERALGVVPRTAACTWSRVARRWTVRLELHGLTTCLGP